MNVEGGDNQLMSEINVTPFVDVMLVLLIIFMVAAPMMTQGVDVSLPEVEGTSISQEENLPLIVSINKDSNVFINDFRVEPAALGEKIKVIIREKPQNKVLLRADKRVPYGAVVEVMSEIRGAGVEKLGMITEPIPAEGRK